MIASRIVIICMHLDDRPVLLHGGYDQVVHLPVVEQFRLVLMVNGGQEFLEFLRGRRAPACDRKGELGGTVQDPPADGFPDCIPRGEETVDVRPAHAELRGNVGNGRLVMTYTTEVLLRYLLDACTHVSLSAPGRTG